MVIVHQSEGGDSRWIA